MHGRLHLDDEAEVTGVKSSRKKTFTIATQLKETRFLDFFFKRLRQNDIADGTQYLPKYQYVSPCGVELNFVRAEDRGMVFTKLSDEKLYYAPSLSVPFDPSSLRISDAGRVYHPAPVGEYGLVASALVSAEFDDKLSVNEDGEFVLNWEGTRCVLAEMQIPSNGK